MKEAHRSRLMRFVPQRIYKRKRSPPYLKSPRPAGEG